MDCEDVEKYAILLDGDRYQKLLSAGCLKPEHFGKKTVPFKRVMVKGTLEDAVIIAGISHNKATQANCASGLPKACVILVMTCKGVLDGIWKERLFVRPWVQTLHFKDPVSSAYPGSIDFVIHELAGPGASQLVSIANANAIAGDEGQCKE